MLWFLAAKIAVQVGWCPFPPVADRILFNSSVETKNAVQFQWEHST